MNLRKKSQKRCSFCRSTTLRKGRWLPPRDGLLRPGFINNPAKKAKKAVFKGVMGTLCAKPTAKKGGRRGFLRSGFCLKQARKSFKHGFLRLLRFLRRVM